MAIIGTDDRVIVPQDTMTTYPFSPVALIVSRFPDGSMSIGSGSIVGRNDVLTAAHVVYDGDAGGWADVVVVPGWYDGATPFGRHRETNITSVSGWVDDADFSYDYALITLGTAVGDMTGTFDVQSVPANSLLGVLLESMGYPGDLGGDFPVYTAGTVDRVADDMLLFLDDMDLYPGQSGSPVIVGSDSDGTPSVIGLVSWHTYWPVNANGILHFSPEIAAQIRRWTQENDDVLAPVASTPAPDPSVPPTFVVNGSPVTGSASGRADLGLTWELIGGVGGETIIATAAGDFVNAAAGDDAVDGGAGNDVLDGGTGSNFLTGAAGQDTFFLDGRGASGAAAVTVWSTVTDWSPGETVTVWGWRNGISRVIEAASDGVPGYQGATLHMDLDADGRIDASVTLAGRALTDPTRTTGATADADYLMLS